MDVELLWNPHPAFYYTIMTSRAVSAYKDWIRIEDDTGDDYEEAIAELIAHLKAEFSTPCDDYENVINSVAEFCLIHPYKVRTWCDDYSPDEDPTA
jgi:hypothetical protein